MNKKNDIIYISGYTDGNGCFHISNYFKKFNASFVISSTNIEIIRHLIINYGGYMRTNENENKKNNKPCYYFVKSRKHAYEFVKKLYPYLIEKKEQCSLYIQFFETICRKTRNNIIKDIKFCKKGKNLITYEVFNKIKATKKNLKPTIEDYIYFAGFIDAECHLGIQHYKPKNRPKTVYKIVIQCNNTQFPIFYWLMNRFGGSCHFIDRKSKDTSRSDQILWKLTGKAFYDLLKNVVNYLRFKKPVAEKLIEFYETTLPNGGDRQSQAFHEAYKKIVIIRESIISDVHKLNHKGIC